MTSNEVILLSRTSSLNLHSLSAANFPSPPSSSTDLTIISTQTSTGTLLPLYTASFLNSWVVFTTTLVEPTLCLRSSRGGGTPYVAWPISHLQITGLLTSKTNVKSLDRPTSSPSLPPFHVPQSTHPDATPPQPIVPSPRSPLGTWLTRPLTLYHSL